MAGTVVAAFVWLLITGFSYYSTDLEHRYFHPDDELMKSSGLLGHGLGIFGALFILTGVFGYMVRKRLKLMSRLGRLKDWLEWHIFLCALGAVLILYHTSFKFDGIVAISFWSLALVVLSGIAGRFIYLQIPHSIEGRELSLMELEALKGSTIESLNQDESKPELIEWLNLHRSIAQTDGLKGWFKNYLDDRANIRQLGRQLKTMQWPVAKTRRIKKIMIEEILLQRQIIWLGTMHKAFRYWHVLHLPVALIMLLFMVIHVVVVVLFGCTWIF